MLSLTYLTSPTVQGENRDLKGSRISSEITRYTFVVGIPRYPPRHLLGPVKSRSVKLIKSFIYFSKQKVIGIATNLEHETFNSLQWNDERM